MKTLSFLTNAYALVMGHIKETTIEDFSFAVFISILIKFVTQSWQVNGLLFVILLLIIALNTWSGVRLARKNKVFDINILKEKLISKLIGYLILILLVSLLVVMVFIASLKDGELLFPEYYLNLIIMLTFVLLGIFEARSISDNLKQMDVHVPKFVDDFIDKAEEKINGQTPKK